MARGTGGGRFVTLAVAVAVGTVSLPIIGNLLTAIVTIIFMIAWLLMRYYFARQGQSFVRIQCRCGRTGFIIR